MTYFYSQPGVSVVFHSEFEIINDGRGGFHILPGVPAEIGSESQGSVHGATIHHITMSVREGTPWVATLISGDPNTTEWNRHTVLL